MVGLFSSRGDNRGFAELKYEREVEKKNKSINWQGITKETLSYAAGQFKTAKVAIWRYRD